jgi:hypothetical protein
VAQLYPRAFGSLYVVSCVSQGYGGGILTLPQPGGPGPRIFILQEQDGTYVHRQFQVQVVFVSEGGIIYSQVKCASVVLKLFRESIFETMGSWRQNELT